MKPIIPGLFDDELFNDDLPDDWPCYYDYLLLVSGWSDAEIEEKTLKILFKEFPDKWHRDSDFYCFQFLLNYYLDKEEIPTIVKNCLKLFGNYINVRLIYKDFDKNIKIHYQAHIKSKGLKKSINNLSNEVDKLKEIEKKLLFSSDCSYCSSITSRYLWPGIEILNGCKSIDDEIVRKIKKTIQDSRDFFEIDHLRELSKHFFHHPNRSFPLPILLKAEEEMPEYKDIWNVKDWYWGDEDENEKENFKNRREDYLKLVPTGKPLAYYSRYDENGCSGPHIVLCPSKIENTASSLKIDTDTIYLIVLIHELAHAMMDKKRVDKTLESIFAHAMEESLANMITLIWFEQYDNNNLQNAKDFMYNQPIVYKFGINQFEAKVDWRKWRDSDRNMHNVLKEWFDACFENGEIKKDITNDFVKNQFDMTLKSQTSS